MLTLLSERNASMFDRAAHGCSMRDEFDGAILDARWTAIGTPSATAPDPYATFLGGAGWRYSLASRSSCLRLQAEVVASNQCGYYALAALPVGSLVAMRGAISHRATGGAANDSNLALAVCAASGWDPNNSVSVALNESDAATVQTEFSKTVAGAYTPIGTGSDVDGRPLAYDVVGLHHRVAGTLDAWAWDSGTGSSVWLGSFAPAHTFGMVAIVARNESNAAPGNQYVDVDWIRVYPTGLIL